MKKVLVCMLAALLLGACSAANMGQLETHNGKTQTVVHSNNAMLASRISIGKIVTGQAGNLKKVQVTLENRWKFKLDFQYKFKWFDKDGFEINPQGEPWHQLVMSGRTQANVQALAPNPAAKSFEIWVQE